MSFVSADESSAPRWPGVLFALLLVLSVLWPAPVVWLNEQTLQRPMRVSYESFLGREAVSWDVAFWGVVGLYLLVLLHGRTDVLKRNGAALMEDARRISGKIRRHKESLRWKSVIAAFVAGACAVAATWYFADAALIAFAESIQTDSTRDVVRLFNRLGGGMNPPLIVAYFFVVGLLFARPRHAEIAMCMLLAGGVAGLLVQILKQVIGRARPELWHGPFHHTWPSATSFPSGHTVGAFALAGVIVFGSRSVPLRIVAMLLAIGVGLSRILAFRHWPSDVLASALIGMVFAWFFVSALMDESPDDDLRS